MTVPGLITSPTCRGCQTLFPVVKRAWPPILTTLALPWTTLCAVKEVTIASATAQATNPVVSLFIVINSAEWIALNLRELYGHPTNCQRVFCKIKKGEL